MTYILIFGKSTGALVGCFACILTISVKGLIVCLVREVWRPNNMPHCDSRLHYNDDWLGEWLLTAPLKFHICIHHTPFDMVLYKSLYKSLKIHIQAHKSCSYIYPKILAFKKKSLCNFGYHLECTDLDTPDTFHFGFNEFLTPENLYLATKNMILSPIWPKIWQF